ncbi:MAG: hypothetical protein JXA11_09560 [Phycisphaerae bacterium]|nr:hypothetical protein [Phycisphaerae bacterium]
MLGISPSTYDYYEASRVPPAELLVSIADIGDVDLRWLLTGQTPAGPAIAADHPAVRRAAELIGDHPQAAEPLAAFLEILAGTMAFPAKDSEQTLGEALTPTEKSVATPVGQEAISPVTAAEPNDARRNWIPILGRSAAGVPRFWSEGEDATGLTTLGDLIARCTDASPTADEIEPAKATVSPNAPDQSVQIITLRTPVAWGKGRDKDDSPGVCQFIAADAIKAKYPDAFAVRIDGDSMSPEIRHGQLVVLSASAPAVAGQPAVVQLSGAIGVTCKLYHPAGRRVNLVPINEQIPPTTVEKNQIEWALRVLARVQPRGQ